MRANDISIARAGALLGSSGISAVVGGIGIGGASLLRTPQAVGQAYKALWNTNYIGPNLKAMLGVGGLPIAAVLADVAAPIAGVGYGLWKGFTATLEDRETGAGRAFLNGIEETAQDVGKYFKKAPEYLGDAYKTVTKPLPEGEEPFDVKILGAVQGLLTGIGTAPAMALGIGALTLYRTPKAIVRAFQEIWDTSREPVLSLTISALVLPTALIADILAPVVGLFYGFGDGVHKGYTKGTVAAFKNSWENVKRYEELTRKAVRRS